jgi:hypothetical protein
MFRILGQNLFQLFGLPVTSEKSMKQMLVTSRDNSCDLLDSMKICNVRHALAPKNNNQGIN